MQNLEGSDTPVLYIGRTVLKGVYEVHLPQPCRTHSAHHPPPLSSPSCRVKIPQFIWTLPTSRSVRLIKIQKFGGNFLWPYDEVGDQNVFTEKLWLMRATGRPADRHLVVAERRCTVMRLPWQPVAAARPTAQRACRVADGDRRTDTCIHSWVV